MNPVLEFLGAWGFLTILPGSRAGVAPTHRMLWGFPLVGLVLGGILYASQSLLVPVVGPRLAALTGVLLLAALSGGLHLDGLADTADGLFCAKSRDERLAILRDPRTGAFGTVSLVFVILAKWEGMASVAPGSRAEAWFLLPIAGRCAQIVACGALPPARADGLGAPVIAQSGLAQVLYGTAALGLAALAAGKPGFAGAATALLGAAVLGGVCVRRLGGATGDVLGATNEVAEALFAVGFAASGMGILRGA